MNASLKKMFTADPARATADIKTARRERDSARKDMSFFGAARLRGARGGVSVVVSMIVPLDVKQRQIGTHPIISIM
jgi:hypothetical protein